jgi:hypothetical protein
MKADDHTTTPTPPTSLPAAHTALTTIQQAIHTAQTPQPSHPTPHPDPQQALATLHLLRQLREQLAHWDTPLIETARNAGATWTDLAAPLGVANRQSAERRYLRQRPGPPGTTGEQRIQATRKHRATHRTTTHHTNTQ